MATWEEVHQIAGTLPEVTRRGNEWRIRSELVAWERPLRKTDLADLGNDAPTGDILAVWLPGLDSKAALLADRPEVYFTTTHFEGYRILLIRLAQIPVDELAELIVEAWLDRAPKRLTRQYMADRE